MKKVYILTSLILLLSCSKNIKNQNEIIDEIAYLDSLTEINIKFIQTTYKENSKTIAFKNAIESISELDELLIQMRNSVNSNKSINDTLIIAYKKKIDIFNKYTLSPLPIMSILIKSNINNKDLLELKRSIALERQIQSNNIIKILYNDYLATKNYFIISDFDKHGKSLRVYSGDSTKTPEPIIIYYGSTIDTIIWDYKTLQYKLPENIPNSFKAKIIGKRNLIEKRIYNFNIHLDLDTVHWASYKY